MARLTCFTCGRSIYTVAPLLALSADERTCARCGAFMRTDRRERERRLAVRRGFGLLPLGHAERRNGERRLVQRRRAFA